MKEIPTKDLFGIFYVKKPDGSKWDSYYKTIDSLRPLFDDEKFIKVIDGFYLNITGDFDSVRISYFVNEKESEKSISIFQDFFTKNGIVQIKDFDSPHEAIIAEMYGGSSYEQRFRNFLTNYTQIGLELLQGNLLHSRRLFAVYRFQVRQASWSFEDYFEPTFNKYSQFYVSFSNNDKRQFFADLKQWPSYQYSEWTHMMVNMIVGCDWSFSPFNNPLSIAKINEILLRKNIGFNIPPTWNPQSFNL